MPSWGNANDEAYDQDMRSYDPAGDPTYRVLKIEDVNDADDAKIAIHAINSSDNNNARALRADGKSDLWGDVEIVGNLEVGDGVNAAEIDARTLEDLRLGTNGGTNNVTIGRNGKTVNMQDSASVDTSLTVGTTLQVSGASTLIGAVGVGNGNTAGEIDARPGAGPTPRDLELGTNAGTDDIVMGGSGHGVVINNRNENDINFITTNSNTGGESRALRAAGKSDFLGYDGTEEGAVVGIFGNLIIDADAVGNPNSDGITLSNASTHASARALHVTSGKSEFDADVQIDADLTVSGDIDAEGDLLVGATGAAGNIDSGGTTLTPKSLKIGSATVTDNVELSRSGQMVDSKADLRMNSNELIMDGSASLSIGSGFVYNATGSGTSGASIDIYISGSKAGYWDSTGWH